MAGFDSQKAFRKGDGGSVSKPIDNRKIFDNLTVIRSHDPLAFDDHHPFIGRLLSDPHYLEKMQERLTSHPSWFKLNHPGGWRVVDGGHFESPLPGPLPPTICETIKEDYKPSVVPEPSSVEMIILGIVCVAAILFNWKMFFELHKGES